MMKKIVMASLLLVMTQFVYAGNAKVGKQIAELRCKPCHGINGISVAPTWPNLAGQKVQYLLAQLQNFKSGARQNPTMQGIVAPLTEEDMNNAAAYFSSLTPAINSQ